VRLRLLRAAPGAHGGEPEVAQLDAGQRSFFEAG
jgi:hypothetical protein